MYEDYDFNRPEPPSYQALMREMAARRLAEREPETRTIPFGFNPRHSTEQIKIVK